MRRTIPRGIPANKVASETLTALANDTFELAIGLAVNLREKREALFGLLNL